MIPQIPPEVLPEHWLKSKPWKLPEVGPKTNKSVIAQKPLFHWCASTKFILNMSCFNQWLSTEDNKSNSIQE